MTNTEYHAHKAVSKSDLDLIHRSPLHYRSAKEMPREQTETLLLGSVVHKLVLEPKDFDNEYAVAPTCDRRTKEGKAVWNNFTAAAKDKTVVSDVIYQKAKNIADSVINHPVAKKLLVNGTAEQSFFWTEDGVECKCRPDYLRNDGIIIDLKTTQDASPESFTKSAYNYRYHVQSWWYMHGLQENGISANNFIFIAVEKEAPYAVCVYAADNLMLELGEKEARADLEVYRNCLMSDVWYGYEKNPQIHSLSLPDWVARKEF